MSQGSDTRQAARSSAARQVVPPHVATWEEIPVGWKHEWEHFVTQDAIYGFCDGVEDRNPWYGPDPTEVGEPVAPPLLLSHAALAELIRPIGIAAGHVATRVETEILAPCRVNTRVRYRGEVTAKFVKRGRRYRVDVVMAEDAETGELFIRDVREYMMGSEPGQEEGSRDEG